MTGNSRHCSSEANKYSGGGGGGQSTKRESAFICKQSSFRSTKGR